MALSKGHVGMLVQVVTVAVLEGGFQKLMS